MSGKLVAIANSKGGVGKTTTCVSLAEAFAAEGRKVLVVDLDMQANASLLVFGHGGDERLYEAISRKRTLKHYLEDNFFGDRRVPLGDVAIARASDVTFRGRLLDISLVASTPGLRRVERELIYELTAQGFAMQAIEKRVGNRLRQDFDRLRGAFDVMLCDCPPGISAMTEAVLTAADLILVPTIPDFMSTLGLDLFAGDVMAQLAKRGASRKPVVMATRYSGSPHQQIVLEAMRAGARGQNVPYEMLETIVPATADFAIDPIALGPSPTLAQKWPNDALVLMNDLLTEVKDRLQ